MKKLLLIACAAILGLNGMAQNNVKFEGVVGMNIAKWTFMILSQVFISV